MAKKTCQLLTLRNCIAGPVAKIRDRFPHHKCVLKTLTGQSLIDLPVNVARRVKEPPREISSLVFLDSTPSTMGSEEGREVNVPYSRVMQLEGVSRSIQRARADVC